MAAETGEESYAEVPYPEKGCSAFVREAVIPLLWRIPDADCSVDDLRPRIWTWLELVQRGDEETMTRPIGIYLPTLWTTVSRPGVGDGSSRTISTNYCVSRFTGSTICRSTIHCMTRRQIAMQSGNYHTAGIDGTMTIKLSM